MRRIGIFNLNELKKGDMLLLKRDGTKVFNEKNVGKQKWILEFIKFKWDGNSDIMKSKFKHRATPLFDGGYAWDRFKNGESMVRNETLFNMKLTNFKIYLIETEDEKEKMNKELIVAKLNYDEVRK